MDIRHFGANHYEFLQSKITMVYLGRMIEEVPGTARALLPGPPSFINIFRVGVEDSPPNTILFDGGIIIPPLSLS